MRQEWFRWLSPEHCGHFDREKITAKVTVFLDDNFPFFRLGKGSAELGSAKDQATSSSPRIWSARPRSSFGTLTLGLELPGRHFENRADHRDIEHAPAGSYNDSDGTYFRLMYFCESIVIARTIINPFTLYWT
jgi:hypothetical protein